MATQGQGLRKLLLMVSLILVGCGASAPASGTSQPSAANPSTAPARSGPTRLTIASPAQISNLATKLEPQRTYGGEYGWLSNSPLAFLNYGVASPLLAAELPSRDNGSWIVNPDGTMQTTWKIKPNARWHDGKPVVAGDFVFAFKVYRDPQIPVSVRDPEIYMDRIDTRDEKTFVIHWKQAYAWANELHYQQMEALPSHQMESVYEAGDPQAFLNHSFWSSTAYVGDGPYRLDQWELGSQLVYRAFDDYFMGRPKIDEVIFRIIPDENAVVANLLGGEVDLTTGLTLGVRAGLTVQSQWSRDEGKVIFAPARWNYAEVQHDPARNQSPGLLDLRVRRAMIHATDRATLAEVSTGGALPIVGDLPVVPADPLHAELERSVPKYAYDPARAVALLQEAGWVKRGDTLVNASGDPFTVEMRSLPGSALPQIDMEIMASEVTKLGMQVNQHLIPPARAGDLEYRVTFPGLNVTQNTIVFPDILRVVFSEQCGTAERRYVGSNRGCWSNAEYDRLYRIATTSLEPRERDNASVGATKVLTEEVAVIGLSYALETLAVRHGLVGPAPRWPGQSGSTWNIHEWYWQ